VFSWGRNLNALKEVEIKQVFSWSCNLALKEVKIKQMFSCGRKLMLKDLEIK
jgi:hypothetical protein